MREDEQPRKVSKSGFFGNEYKHLPSGSSKLSIASISAWKSLEEAIEKKNKTKAIRCLEEISSEVGELSIKTNPTEEEIKLLMKNVINILTRALRNFEDILGKYGVAEEPDKISYWVVRAIFHVVGKWLDLLPEEIIARIRWFPKYLLAEEYERYKNFSDRVTFAEIEYNSGFLPNPVDFFQGNIATIICHPLYDALWHHSQKVSELLLWPRELQCWEEEWSLLGKHTPRMYQAHYNLGDQSPETLATINFWNTYVLAKFRIDISRAISPLRDKLPKELVQLIEQYITVEKIDYQQRDLDKRGFISKTNPDGDENSCCLIL